MKELEPPPDPEGPSLLSDEPTIELVLQARGGDRMALESLLERCLPPLKRWAHGRLPAHARGSLDTGDLVQEAALHVLARLDKFEPRHVGAMQAYLRMSVINRIRDEAYQRYRGALRQLRTRDREMVVARIEVQWSISEIAHRFGMASVDAARVAVSRSLKRLSAQFTA